MRKLFTDPTIEIRNFAMENIVTTSATGEKYTEGTIDDLKNNSAYTKAIVNAQEVLHFNQ